MDCKEKDTLTLRWLVIGILFTFLHRLILKVGRLLNRGDWWRLRHALCGVVTRSDVLPLKRTDRQVWLHPGVDGALPPLVLRMLSVAGCPVLVAPYIFYLCCAGAFLARLRIVEWLRLCRLQNLLSRPDSPLLHCISILRRIKLIFFDCCLIWLLPNRLSFSVRRQRWLLIFRRLAY